MKVRIELQVDLDLPDDKDPLDIASSILVVQDEHQNRALGITGTIGGTKSPNSGTYNIVKSTMTGFKLVEGGK